MKNGNGRNGAVHLAEFLKNFEGRAYCVAFRLCRNKEEARDLVQEACYRALRKWDLYDPTKRIDSWFLTIIRNVFIDERRSARWRRRAVDQIVTEDGERVSRLEICTSPERPVLEVLMRNETNGLVRQVMGSLKPWQREALSLREIEGFRYEAIAKRLEIPVGTVRSRISRARQCLRKALTKRDPEFISGHASGR